MTRSRLSYYAHVSGAYLYYATANWPALLMAKSAGECCARSTLAFPLLAERRIEAYHQALVEDLSVTSFSEAPAIVALVESVGTVVVEDVS